MEFVMTAKIHVTQQDILPTHPARISQKMDVTFIIGDFIKNMREDDALIITADHGCDPVFKGTDHTRECVPFVLYGKNIEPENLGTIEGYDYISKVVKEILIKE